jgi:dUTP pyrophosphatase
MQTDLMNAAAATTIADTNKLLDSAVVAAIGPDESQQDATNQRKRRRPIDGGGSDIEAYPRVLKCKRLHDDAQLPKRETTGAAGYDLVAVQSTTVPARGRAKVPTGLAVEIPFGYYGRVAPRSSMSSNGVDVAAGVIDSDYRGEVIVMLVNQRDATYVVELGDSVAQLVIEKIACPDPEWADELDSTQRGAGGFGSTGR